MGSVKDGYGRVCMVGLKENGYGNLERVVDRWKMGMVECEVISGVRQ